MKEMNRPKIRMTPRRSLLKGAMGGAAAVGLGAFAGTMPALAATSEVPGLTAGDVAILRFLAAAELIETDLWVQYCELAEGNKAYGDALNKIENELVIYTCDVAGDEQSHANLINGFLAANGQAPVNLDAFRTLPSSTATGARQIGRLTNLMQVTVDTSWYRRYRDSGNPDFGASYPQFVNIVDRPLIPLDNRHYTATEIQLIANSAAFHFCATEQGGTSIYPTLIPKVTNLDVLRILTGIGPSEAYFFCSFHQSLEGLPAISGDGLVFPDVRVNDIGAHHIPHPCKFINPALPLACVVRPGLTPNGGAVHLFQAGINSHLFKGQSEQFFDTVMGLAVAADAASRTL
ncbi:MAG: ferritin-like domain-containing protein [Chloroflexota bacterium]